jgi:hypothetical protein
VYTLLPEKARAAFWGFLLKARGAYAIIDKKRQKPAPGEERRT